MTGETFVRHDNSMEVFLISEISVQFYRLTCWSVPTRLQNSRGDVEVMKSESKSLLHSFVILKTALIPPSATKES